MYKLLIEDDEGGRTAVSLVRDEITIGRKEGNTIRLTDRNVSRRHGRIVREDGHIYVENVEARYGIEKNGQPIADRAELEEGDVVVIGDYRLTLQSDTKGKKSKEKEQGAAYDEARNEATQIIQTLPAKLVVISSNFAGEEFPLVEKEMVIGRSESCNIIIGHQSISGKHAKIVREDSSTYKIVDLKSKNGVRVSGEEYRATLLQRGDVIELGHVKFRFVEPGENYVFTPQATDDTAATAAVGAGGMDRLQLVGMLGAAAAVVILVGLFLFLGGDDDEMVGEVVDDDETAIAIQEIEELEEAGEEGRVDIAIERAEEGIKAGLLNEPATRLETIRDMMDPSADQEERISSLERKIQNMRPFKDYYLAAVDALDDGDYLTALNEAEQIPGHLPLRTRLEDEGVLDDIFAGMLDMARQQLEEENLEEARELANEALLVDSDLRVAHQLLEEVDEKERELEALATQRAEARAAASAQSDSGTPTSTQQPSTNQTGSSSGGGGLSAAEARQKYIEAARQVTGGNPGEAVRICNEALAAGHSDCHRILGLAHGRMGDTASACRHFRAYLATGPGNPAAVEAQMNNYGCD